MPPRFNWQKNRHLQVIILLIALVVIGYLIMSYVDYMHNIKRLDFVLAPLLSGIVVAGFTYGMVYVDGLNADVEPKEPFPRRPNGCSQMLQLGYVGAIASGLIVTLIMYVNA